MEHAAILCQIAVRASPARLGSAGLRIFNAGRRTILFSGLFLTLLLFTQVDRFAKLKFFLSWWAYSFPRTLKLCHCPDTRSRRGRRSYRTPKPDVRSAYIA
jgi:hypothetical protein